MSEPIDVTCPCCSTRLRVDATSGEVLSEERPKADHAKNFDDAMNKVRGGAAKREEAFAKAFDRTQKLDDLLEKKFEEARKKAEKDPSKKPRTPFDMD